MYVGAVIANIAKVIQLIRTPDRETDRQTDRQTESTNIMTICFYFSVRQFPNYTATATAKISHAVLALRVYL